MFADRHFHRTGRWHKQSELPSADVTAPVITVGPSVSGITDTKADVAWTTDEAATGVVGYGLNAPGGAGGEIALVKSLTITGAQTNVTIPTAGLDFAIGDLVVIAMTKRFAYAVFTQVAPTSGWTFEYNAIWTDDNDQTMAVVTKVISGGEPVNWEFNRGGESSSVKDWSAIVFVFRAAGDIEAKATLVQGLNDFTPDAPDITTLAANAVVLTGHHSSTRYLDVTTTATPGAPEGFDSIRTAIAPAAFTSVARKVEATAGVKSYGSWRHTPDDAQSEYQTWTLSIAPKPDVASTGRAADYDAQSSFEGAYTTAHAISLSGLAPDTTYHYVAESEDAAGNVVTSADDTFATNAGQSGDPGGYPPTTIGRTFNEWEGDLISEPALGAYIQDPDWPGRIWRVHSSARAQYSKKPAWNADMSRLLLLRGGPVMLNGRPPFALIGSVSVSSGFTWSATNPNMGYYTSGGSLYRVNPGVSSAQLIRSFGSDYHLSSEGRQSIDDRYIALKRGDERGMLFYDVQADSILGTSASFNGDVDWVSTAPSGDYALVRFDAGGTGSQQGTWLYSRSGSPVRNLNSGGHGDVARDANGNDIYVGQDGGSYAAWRLGTTSKTTILGGWIGSHVSGVMFQRLGWVTISNNAASANDGWPFVLGGGTYRSQPGHDQVHHLRTDGSGEVQVFCQARTIQNLQDDNGSPWPNTYQYALSTHAVTSPDGKMVTWGGAWQRFVNGSTTARGFVTLIP